MTLALQLTGYALFTGLFYGLLLFLPAGTFDYWQAWVFIAMFVTASVVQSGYLAVTAPDALRRRTRPGPFAETRPLQRLIHTGIVLTSVSAAVIAALDHRFGWSTVPTTVVVIGDLLVVAGLAVALLTIAQNNYAAATITVESGQPVVSTGLYAVLRHPMYAAALIVTAGTPVALGSYWGLVVLIPAVAVFVARIADEEKALREDLPGYREYTDKVSYRLVPGVW
ncbi:MAG: isoprenylcysteine carboxylmethyltransferase family protein [Mycolicibacterium hassiacum]|uniref:methyltransferase family protein n=1 Tax=Mycolicibacterium hassiacum TaxID=46351 RepID=UPI0023F7A1D3|nr:isoprenylcysteine carboxylmethyltransferase family protein [Mycolicibacterium hassiacum]MBX5487504.1 isoprenylcysteine carboxylmethyltransferase family protein [Mycolicibacterium hassiacum]